MGYWCVFGSDSLEGRLFDYIEVNILVIDVTKMNYVVDIQAIIYRFQNDKDKYGFPHALPITCQQQMHDYSSTITGKQVIMHLKDHNIVILIDSGHSNLPMV